MGINLPIVMSALENRVTPFSKLTLQVYLPVSADSTKGRLAAAVYSVSDFISGLVEGARRVPSGASHSILMENGTDTADAELSSTVQIKVRGCPEYKGLGE